MNPSAVGFRVKSGWAAAVLVAGPIAEPKVVDCRHVQLADAAVPDSIQPFHAGLNRPKGEGEKEVRRLVHVVERFAGRSVTGLLQEYYDAGHRIAGVGIVVGSTADPASIPNEHIRAHAEEGGLFRRVLEEAARRIDLPATVIVEKRLLAQASKLLGRSEHQLRQHVTLLGRGRSGGWRAEQKAASLAAWMMLF